MRRGSRRADDGPVASFDVYAATGSGECQVSPSWMRDSSRTWITHAASGRSLR